MSLTLKEAVISHRELRLPRDQSVIEAHAELLESGDRELIAAVIVLGQPVRMVARLTGVSPSTLRRRVRKLIKRINSPEFVAAARSLHLLNDTQSAVAKNHILHGKSLRATAGIMGMPYHTVRKSLVEAVGIIEGMRNIRKNFFTS